MSTTFGWYEGTQRLDDTKEHTVWTIWVCVYGSITMVIINSRRGCVCQIIVYIWHLKLSNILETDLNKLEKDIITNNT